MAGHSEHAGARCCKARTRIDAGISQRKSSPTSCQQMGHSSVSRLRVVNARAPPRPSRARGASGSGSFSRGAAAVGETVRPRCRAPSSLRDLRARCGVSGSSASARGGGGAIGADSSTRARTTVGAWATVASWARARGSWPLSPRHVGDCVPGGLARHPSPCRPPPP